MRTLFCLAVGLLLAGCSQSANLKDPPVPTAPGGADKESVDAASAAGAYQVKFETSKGDFIIEVNPDWAPLGAERFRELVESKFYDDCRFFRVLDGFMAQVGMNGDPAVHAKYEYDTIADDKVIKSNKRGFVTFATSGPDSRTTQFFINFADNGNLDGMGFAPFGRVVEGMNVVDSLYSGYGEGAPQGNGPSQGLIKQRGNEYLNAEFPKLDYIKTARIVGGMDASAPATDAAPLDAPGTDATAPDAAAEATAAP